MLQTLIKSALTIPPRPLQPAPVATQQAVLPPNALQQGAGPIASSPTQVQSVQGRGRPVGSVMPGANPVMAPQVGMPQQSAVAQLGGQTSTPAAKGFGNTPTSSTASAGKGSKSTGGMKAANAGMGYGTTAMGMPSKAPGMSATASGMPIMTPTSSSTPVRMPNVPMTNSTMKFSSAELGLRAANLPVHRSHTGTHSTYILQLARMWGIGRNEN